MINKNLIKKIIAIELELEAQQISLKEYTESMKEFVLIEDYQIIREEVRFALQSLKGIGEEIKNVNTLYENIQLRYKALEEKFYSQNRTNKKEIDRVEKTKLYQPFIIEAFDENILCLNLIKQKKTEIESLLKYFRNLNKSFN